MRQAKYKHVEQDGVSFDLPEGLEIRGHVPRLLAMSRDQTKSFYFEMNPHEVVWDGVRRLIHRPMPPDDEAERKRCQEGSEENSSAGLGC
jgi:hypothetical protein